jgi:hypothetical protein
VAQVLVAEEVIPWQEAVAAVLDCLVLAQTEQEPPQPVVAEVVPQEPQPTEQRAVHRQVVRVDYMEEVVAEQTMTPTQAALEQQGPLEHVG